tara:strand:+ start:564 stop:905 length:342 start_codon:yes stop_codon:yes gene_type:complete
MAITHTETINNLIVINDGTGTDLVSQVIIKTVSVDDSDPPNLTQTNLDNYRLDTSGGTSAAGFVAYDSLTDTVVKNWISTELAESNTKTNAENTINAIKSPPTPIEVDKTLPW